jgi:hypothetical protein
MSHVVNSEFDPSASAATLAIQPITGSAKTHATAARATLFEAGQCTERPLSRWLRRSRKSFADRVARASAIRVLPNAPIDELSHHRSDAATRALKLAAIHLRNGEEFAVIADVENEAYLYNCLQGSSDTPRIGWFKTVDGSFVGLNASQVNAIFWYSPDTTAMWPTGFNPENLIAHFFDKESIALPRITGDEIDRLRGATMSKHRGTAFFTLVTTRPYRSISRQ